MNRFKRIAVVVNPAAQNGKAAAASEQAERFLTSAVGSDSFTLFRTRYPKHATDLVAQLHPSYGTVITIGGDGLVHEVANGLMGIDEAHRPLLAVVPVGSGNDYAETLGMTSARTIDDALARIFDFQVVPMDVGCVNGEYFVQTLSFGVDAAIALDTVQRRRRTGRTGTVLYLESGIDQMLHHLNELRYEAYLGGVPAANEVFIEGSAYMFAVQIGPTYGGHFKVCPQADPSDGFFDICLAHPPLNALSATALFLLAKGGHHTRFRRIAFHRAQRLTIHFETEPPAQADGERVKGTTFHVETIPQALRVFTTSMVL